MGLNVFWTKLLRSKILIYLFIYLFFSKNCNCLTISKELTEKIDFPFDLSLKQIYYVVSSEISTELH